MSETDSDVLSIDLDSEGCEQVVGGSVGELGRILHLEALVLVLVVLQRVEQYLGRVVLEVPCL